MKQIYKFYQLSEESIKRIYVFVGISSDTMSKEPEKITDLEQFFSEDEQKRITDEDIPVYKVHDMISRDNTFQDVLLKISNAMSTFVPTSYDSLHMFYTSKEEVSSEKIMENINEYTSLEEKYDYILTFSKNISDDSEITFDHIEKMREKGETLTYTMIKKIKFKPQHEIKKPCGIHYKIPDFISINPFTGPQNKIYSEQEINFLLTTRYNQCLYSSPKMLIYFILQTLMMYLVLLMKMKMIYF